jgi:hypothetical protein
MSNDQTTSRTPDEIQADIERQREQLAGTIDALSAKLDVKAQARSKVAELRARVMTEDGRPRPELIAVGAGLVVVTVAVVWWRVR